MKKTPILIIAAALFLASCSKEKEEVAPIPGKLLLTTSASADIILKGSLDASNYNVTITKDGNTTPSVSKTVGEITGAIDLLPGTYSVKVKSGDFTAPAFDTPVYGAEASGVVVESEKTTNKAIVCTQTNAAIKIGYATEFDAYCVSKGYDYGVEVVAGANTLSYGKKSTALEARKGYFLPGTVTIKVSMNGNVYTKDIILAAKEEVNVNININKLPTPKLQLTISGDDATNTSTETFTFNE